MKTKVFFLIYFLLFMWFLYGCPNFPFEEKKIIECQNISIHNNSNSKICCLFSNSLDTLLFFNNPLELNSKKIYCINSDSILEISPEDYYIDIEGKKINTTIRIYIFDYFQLNNTPWDSIRKNYLVLKRFNFSVEELNRQGWKVNFPE